MSASSPNNIPMPARHAWCLALVVSSVFFTLSSVAFAEVEKEKEAPARIAEPTAQPAQTKPLSAEEIVAAIKLRAQRELAKRRARKWAFNALATWTVGNESNPAQSSARKEALYMEEYLSTTFSYKLHPRLSWQASYSLDALNYNEYTDGSTLTNSLLTKLIWRPLKAWRLEAHYSFDDSDYPYDAGASTWDQKVHLRLRQSFLKNYYHYVGWTYLNKQYKDKLKRESDSTRTPGKYRKDNRHTAMYEIGGTVGEGNTLKLKQEFYFNDSNEGHQDYNDAQDYKVRLSFNREWTKQWSTSTTYTYETKRYERRSVAGITVSQQDNTNTYDFGLTYKLTPSLDLTYAWKHKRNRSNDIGQAYIDVTNSLALTTSF